MSTFLGRKGGQRRWSSGKAGGGDSREERGKVRQGVDFLRGGGNFLEERGVGLINEKRKK